MAFSTVAAITDQGHQRLAQMLLTGKSFAITHFAVGSGGHDPLDPAVALVPQVEATNFAPVLFGPEPIDAISLANPFCPQFTCRLEATEAIGQVSSIALYGTVLYPTTDVEYGTRFLFAIANFPLQNKIDEQELILVVTPQL